MAQWRTDVKHEPSSINNGNQYEKKDRVSREQLNALAENSFYAVNKSEEAIEKANSAFKANGTLVTINGENQTTWSADFAESERQKTLNLCSLKNERHTNVGVTAVYNAETQTITLNGTASADGDIMYNSRNILPNISNMQGKTVTASLYVVSGSYSGHFRSFLGTYDNSNIWSDRFQLANFENGDLVTHYERLYIPNNLTYDTLMFYCHGGTTFNNLVLKVQFVEGEARDEWRYPYGAIVHEKDMKDVEHIETIYDMTSSDSNINWGYTGGIPTGTTITNKDFTKYKKLIVWYYNGYLGGVCEIPLNAESGHAYRGTHCGTSWDGNAVFYGGISASVKDAKTSFNVEWIVYTNSVSNTARVTKIVGVF